MTLVATGLLDQMAKVEKLKARDRLSMESLKASVSLAKFYSGLPSWDVFSVAFEFVKGDLLSKSSVTHFHQLLMTLIKLRLSVSCQDIGYRFGVHMSTAVLFLMLLRCFMSN